jgi:hypothetical protein
VAGPTAQRGHALREFACSRRPCAWHPASRLPVRFTDGWGCDGKVAAPATLLTDRPTPEDSPAQPPALGPSSPTRGPGVGSGPRGAPARRKICEQEVTEATEISEKCFHSPSVNSTRLSSPKSVASCANLSATASLPGLRGRGHTVFASLETNGGPASVADLAHPTCPTRLVPPEGGWGTKKVPKLFPRAWKLGVLDFRFCV